jgi:Resolvase, N terminal domain
MQAPLSGDERELAAHHRLHNNLRNFQFWSACTLVREHMVRGFAVVSRTVPVNLPSRAEQVSDFPPLAGKLGKSRPNEMPLSFSDDMPHDVVKANGTKRRRAMIVGYARTSTWKAAGVDKVFSEQASSVAQRTKLTECLSFLRDGDVLTVTKPDRLARSTAELLAIEADLSAVLA